MKLLRTSTSIVIGLVSSSCFLLSNLAPRGGGLITADSSPSNDISPVGRAATETDFTEITDPRVEGTLSLRSVHMELNTDIPGEDPDRTQIFVDAAGNARIERNLPTFEDPEITPVSPDWYILEIFIVDEKAYTRMGKSGSAKAQPDLDHALSDLLYAPTGPGMWLILLPRESLTSQGNESKGGFEAVRYNMAGSLVSSDIRGQCWVDEPTGALVGMDLSLPEQFFLSSDENRSGTVKITFSVAKADVPPIALP